MQVTITLSGQMGSGKTVIAGFLARELASRFGVTVEIAQGSHRRGPDNDTVRVHTTPHILREIANSK